MTRLTSVGLLVSMIHLGCSGASDNADPNGSANGGASDHGAVPAAAGTFAKSTPSAGSGGRASVQRGTGGAHEDAKPSTNPAPDTNDDGVIPNDTASGGGATDPIPSEPTNPMIGSAGAPNTETSPSGTGGAPSVDPTPTTGGTAGDTSVPMPPAPADTDGDGVLDREDLCPATATGLKVNANGCEAVVEAGVKAAWGSPVPPSAIRAVPNSGTVEANGFVNLVVDPQSRFPMVFRVHQSELTQTENGYHASGAALLDVPGDVITLKQVDLTFEYGDNRGEGLHYVRGRSQLPLPNFAGVVKLKGDAPVAEIGIEQGSNLHDLHAPLSDDRRYLYFRFSDKLDLELGSLKLELPAMTDHLLALDHTDPMFFVRATCSGIPGLPVQLEDAGLGFSRQGLLPFTPKETWGLPASGPNSSAGFSGQMYIETKVGLEIPETPIQLSAGGNAVLDIDPTRSGRTVFTDPLNGLRFGANRSLGVKVDFIPSLASFEMELGSASMDLSLLKDQKSGYLSGVIYPGKSFFNDVVPILPQTALKVAGAIASPISDSRFAMGGDVALKLSKLNTMLNLSLSDVPLASAELGIDKNGLSMRGNAQASLISALGMNGQATFDASFPGDLETSAWYVDMNGNLSVHGVGLSGATRAHLDRSGLQVDGRLATALGGIAVTGRIDQNGATLRGRANVSIPMVAGATVVSNAVDGVACGYEKITSAAVCGADTLEGWSKCGVKFVASCLVSSCETPKCSIPHTCDDFSRPKACPHNVINPNFNYGTFQGTVDVTIGPGGVQATLSGVCVAGQCSSSPTTSVDLSSSQACVQLPGISQKFCAKF